MSDVYSLAADAVLLLHAAVVLFVLAGQTLICIGWWRGWRWTRARFWRAVHLTTIGCVALQGWCNVACPLTLLENWLRVRGGARPYRSGFVADWVARLLFYDAPAWVFTFLYSAFALLVIATFVLYPPRQNRGCKRGSNHAK